MSLACTGKVMLTFFMIYSFVALIDPA